MKTAEDIDLSKEDSFLLVYLTKKQKEWLECYGNVITCMDRVYKTLRYGFPCYFLVVKTSIGIGRVVGTIIPQYATEELIAEGLKIIKQWNPWWSPKFFMTDKSSQELGMVSLTWLIVFELELFYRCYWCGTTKVFRLVCDFHSLQAMERWINKSSNGVKFEDKATVKSSFRTLLYATSS